jgi:predicted nuclease with RNAse H fold
MRTAGIDLSSQDRRTAACIVSWCDGAATVESLHVGVGDAEIVDILGHVDKAGIDVPLGWPSAFVDAVAQHGRAGTWPTDYIHADTKAYRYRRTDLHTWHTVRGAPPLSVSTDRIGIPAMRAAALLSKVRPRVALEGSGVVVETYPAAALRIWGFSSSGYKRPENTSVRAALVSTFLAKAGWLSISAEQQSQCEASDDALDAVISACVARAAALGLVHPVPDVEAEAARREGWIMLPTKGSLPGLGGPR